MLYTAPTMSKFVLHHYNESPYAEKIRALMGYKGLSWQSVIVPRMAPKPDLVALTGGYRKVPVLQIGADVYCDTRLITEVVDVLSPQPSARTQPGGFDELLAHWADNILFGKAVAFTFGRNVDRLPDIFLADRAALRGAPLDREALKRAVPLAEQELRALLPWLENAFSGPHAFANGAQPGNGDFSLYASLWFMQQGGFDFSAWPLVTAWLSQMQAFGHGTRMDMTPEDALALAAQSQPLPLSAGSVSPDASGAALGQLVRVSPEQLGHGTSVTGELVAINPQRMTLLVLSERCGALHVHFPRVGYGVRAAN
jgi:glutathione S-transferase